MDCVNVPWIGKISLLNKILYVPVFYKIKFMEVFSSIVLLYSYILYFLLLQNLNASNFYPMLLFNDEIFLIYGI